MSLEVVDEVFCGFMPSHAIPDVLLVVLAATFTVTAGVIVLRLASSSTRQG